MISQKELSVVMAITALTQSAPHAPKNAVSPPGTTMVHMKFDQDLPTRLGYILV